jgi:hypothetical protein
MLRAAAAALLAAFAGGCGTIAIRVNTYEAYDGPRLPDADISRIRERDSHSFIYAVSKNNQLVWMNPERPGYALIRLMPGAYEIDYRFVGCYSDVAAIDSIASGAGDALAHKDSDLATVTLEAGHTYSLRDDGCLKSSNHGFWIEDDANAKVIAELGHGAPADQEAAVLRRRPAQINPEIGAVCQDLAGNAFVRCYNERAARANSPR